MINSLFGLKVARAIPPEVVTGLVTGQYKLYGGVIRGAAGTEYAGQIIRHLIPVATQTTVSSVVNPISGVFGVVNTVQLHKLSGQINALTATTAQILQVASATMALSGLNLAVSLVEFAVLNQRLNSIETTLQEIKQEVKEVRALLELKECAELSTALKKVLTINNVPDRIRQDTLLTAKTTLDQASFVYKRLLENADKLEAAMAYEEYFCLAALAHVRCEAELGMADQACQTLEEAIKVWAKQARRIAAEFVLGNNPERFLFSDFVDSVPIPVLIEWRDFAGAEEKGFAQIDELRGKITSWYSRENYAEVVEGVSAMGKMLNKAIKPNAAKTVRRIGLGFDKQMAIPSMNKLVARHKVLEGYQSQYRFLADHKLKPTEFENELALLGENAAVEGYIILQPDEGLSLGKFFNPGYGTKR